MTIEQIIKYLPAPICGYTDIGKEKQKEYDAHNSAVIILRKYEKIQKIVENYDKGILKENDGVYAFKQIREVIEDGRIVQ